MGIVDFILLVFAALAVLLLAASVLAVAMSVSFFRKMSHKIDKRKKRND